MFSSKKRKAVDTDGGEIMIDPQSRSLKMEGYNRLRDNILYLNADGDKKVIQIESAVMHEGKTTLVSNLAVSLGLTDKKVIVLDLDFRNPKLHRKFKLDIDNGFAEYILGTITKEQLIKKTTYKNVDVVTRGGKIYNSSLIFISNKFKELIKELRKEYDYILLDCAPVLQISDYINILPVSDGVLFAVAYGMTTRSQVSEAIKELRKGGANILGSVFTMYDRKKNADYNYSKYYGRKYYYYYYYNTNDDPNKRVKKRKKKRLYSYYSYTSPKDESDNSSKK